MGRWTDRRAEAHSAAFKDHDRTLVSGERDWMVCGHCFYGWLVEPGSGRRRGFCNFCAKVLCGRDLTACRPCRKLPPDETLTMIQRIREKIEAAGNHKGRWA